LIRTETGNEGDAAHGVNPDRVAHAHQIVDRWRDIEDRCRLRVYGVFARAYPENPLRVVPRTLDGVDRIKQVEEVERLVAPGHSADFAAITIAPVEYLAAEMNVGAGSLARKSRASPSFNRSRTQSALWAASRSANRRRY